MMKDSNVCVIDLFPFFYYKNETIVVSSIVRKQSTKYVKTLILGGFSNISTTKEFDTMVVSLWLYIFEFLYQNFGVIQNIVKISTYKMEITLHHKATTSEQPTSYFLQNGYSKKVYFIGQLDLLFKSLNSLSLE